uniref:Uncharacterized protein n=1 Tax=Rhizophora mucronata TaxID=61149 RepID=A0A2P2PZG7_RHIMU
MSNIGICNKYNKRNKDFFFIWFKEIKKY